jgi:PAS domain S-box-containing protein
LWHRARIMTVPSIEAMNDTAAPWALSQEMLNRFAGPLLTAAEHAGLGVSVSLVEGTDVRRLYVNRAAAHTLGYEPEELVGNSTFLTFAPEEKGRMEQLMQDWRKGLAIPRFLETVGLRKDGTRVPIEVAYSSVTLDGKPVSIAFIRDISERQRTESALRASEALFRKLIEAAPDAILVSRDNAPVYANPGYLRLTGYSSLGELVMRGISILHPADRAAGLARRRVIMESGEPSSPREYRIVRRDGRHIWVECLSLPIDFEGSPAILTFMRDINERREAQAQLIQTDRMATIGTLAAGVAHELNNPLAYILLNLGLFERELSELVHQPEDRDRIKSRLRTLQEGAERMATIVRDLRSFCRPNSKTLRPVDLRQVLESAINMAMNELKDRARIVRDYSPVPPVVADAARLGQVFLNLLLNAAQAMNGTDSEATSGPNERAEQSRASDENEVRVTLRLEDDRIRVEIADSGRGIPPEIIGRIFEPFFTTKPAGIGTGLGLSISQTIVNGMNGELTVESEPGRGATFAVLLPLPEEVPPSSVEPLVERPTPPRSDSIPRLLVVDDETALAMALKKVLESDHQVTAVTTGRAALDLLLENGLFDVVLCDVLMPGLSGIDLYREVERRRPELMRQIIFMSGASSMPRVAEFFASIPNERIDKPVDVDQLRSLIRQIAAASRSAS